LANAFETNVARMPPRPENAVRTQRATSDDHASTGSPWEHNRNISRYRQAIPLPLRTITRLTGTKGISRYRNAENNAIQREN
jgi:hypothetical protein